MAMLEATVMSAMRPRAFLRVGNSLRANMITAGHSR